MSICDSPYPATVISHPDGTDQCICLICKRCGHHTGNSSQGHYWMACQVTGTLRRFHFCCPDDCEIDAADAPKQVAS